MQQRHITSGEPAFDYNLIRQTYHDRARGSIGARADIRRQDYTAYFSRSGDYAFFYYDDRTDDQRALPDKGKKIHLSLDNTEGNIRAAYNLVLPILIRYRVPLFKLLPAGIERMQPGKSLVIYHAGTDGVRWPDLLNEIEQALRGAGAAPGVAPHHRIDVRRGLCGCCCKERGVEPDGSTEVDETRITGSHYFYLTDDSIPTLAGRISDPGIVEYAERLGIHAMGARVEEGLEEESRSATGVRPSV